MDKAALQLHHLLERQLKQFNLSAAEMPAVELSRWKDFLTKISKVYTEFDQYRYTMERSLNISSQEMEALNKELTEKRNRLQAIMSEGMCFIASDWTIESLNPEAERLLKCDNIAVVGQTFYNSIKIFDPAIENYLTKDFLIELSMRGVTYKQEDAYILQQGGTQFPASYAINFIMDNGQFTGAVVVFRDITHRKMAEQALMERTVHAEQLVQEQSDKLNKSIDELKNKSVELAYKETHDSLTGLLNRTEFEKKLEFFVKSVQGTGIEHDLIYMDLDQFKIINDDCGHVAGDKMLQIVGNLLISQLRKWDLVARLGGDEFGILLLYCSKSQALKIAKLLKDAVQNLRFEWNGKIYSFTVSIGISPISKDYGDFQTVLKNADTACYVAKDAGRNRIHVFHTHDEDFNKKHNELRRVTDINRALEENRFKLFYQAIAPIENLSNRSAHFEILIRMIDEEGKIIMPGDFLFAAERYNLIGKIDRWVVAEVFKMLSLHPEQLDKIEICSINLSGQTMTDDTFTAYVAGLLKQYQIPASIICFEVTETAAIANLAKAIDFINELKQYGCKFALDDFGSGLSSFAYLKNLPVDYLKIDGIFVKDLTKTHVDYAMVKSINDIGHVMGKKTIAEFVENDAILDKLKEIGVNYAQGYGVAKPADLQAFLDNKPDKK